MNHPFLDGNKRTGYVLMESLLRVENYKITSSDEDLYKFIVTIPTGEIQFNQIVGWLRANTIFLN